MSATIGYTPIGVVRSPYRELAEMPIQPAGAAGSRGTVEIAPRWAEGLRDLEGFSHLILIYHFHRAPAPRLTVVPFLDTVARGLFATRAPCRPNPIGLSVVALTGIAGTTLHIADVDILDGTPLLDLKPFVPAFDRVEHPRVGWLEGKDSEIGRRVADGRFDGGNNGD